MNSNTQRGIALPFVVFALSVMASLVAGTFVLALNDVRSGQASLVWQSMQGEAESLMNRALSSLDPVELAELPIGSTSVALTGLPPGTRVFRVNLHVFFLTASVSSGGHFSFRRSVGRVFRIDAPAVGLTLGLTTPGTVTLGPAATVHGQAAFSPLACNDPSRPTGAGPPQASYWSGVSEALAAWAAHTTVGVVAGAIVTPAPSISSAGCNVAHPANWGDPLRPNTPCGRHFPVVHAAGDLEVRGGVGQGVLLVDGDLTASGGFQFRGLVIVGGALRTAGAGAKFAGAVQVDDAAGTGTTLSGATVIAHSACDIEEAVLPRGSISPLRERSWVQLY